MPVPPDIPGSSADSGSESDNGPMSDGSGDNSTATSNADSGSAGECTLMTSELADSLRKCPADICPAQDSVCVPGTVLESMMVPQDTIDQLADCDAENKCVPAVYVDTQNTFTLPTCISVNGAEGRCLSTCIARVAEQADRLPQTDCAANELCSPCFDPLSGEDTGACHLGCDPGPATMGMPFDHCCEDRGRCVTTELAGDQAASLLQLDCDEGLLCSPTELAQPGFMPAKCASLAGAEGRCLSTCVAAVAAQIDTLPTEGCGMNERCAPCYDPVTLEPTGACTVGGDAPVADPAGFASCCGDRGICVPPALAGDQVSSLSQATCDTDLLCTPKDLTDPAFKPASCDSLGGFEGRCLPDCLGAVEDQADRLPTAGCATGEVCAPCTDPVTEEDTGACSINGDEPAKPAEAFAKCCPQADGSNRGVCVTEELAGDRAASLLPDECASDLLCAPVENAQDPDFKFPDCETEGGFGSIEGACVPECIVDNIAEEDLALIAPVQGTCGAQELCVACAVLLVGLPLGSTGACD